MNYDYNDSKYTKIISKNRNYINNTPENNNIYNKDNFISKNFYSNSMIEPKMNQNLLNTQNYQLLSSYPNNLNYKYKNDTPFNPKNKEQNSIQNDYKYIPNNELNNNPKNLFPNILASPNDKNISLTSQISQEIDRQKLKFDEMVEKAKNINNSELFEFDLKKYLPKENFEDTKTFRKYKDLIKPKNKINNNIDSNRNNLYKDNKDLNYDDIRDNSLSEIPIKNDNLFEDELSKSGLNFNLDNKEIIENERNNFDLNPNQLKQNLMKNFDYYNSKDINNIHIENNKENLNQENNKNIEKGLSNKNKLNQIINSSPNLSDVNLKNKNGKENCIKKPYFCIYYEEINSEENESKDEESDDENINDIEKLNLEFNKENKDNININDYIWHCLDFYEDKPETNFNNFFNS